MAVHPTVSMQTGGIIICIIIYLKYKMYLKYEMYL